MSPSWLVRLNDLLALLNPVLAGVAALLTLLVIAVAAERLPAVASRAVTQAARPAGVVASLECPPAALPPKWRDLQLYD